MMSKICFKIHKFEDIPSKIYEHEKITTFYFYILFCSNL